MLVSQIQLCWRCAHYKCLLSSYYNRTLAPAMLLGVTKVTKKTWLGFRLIYFRSHVRKDLWLNMKNVHSYICLDSARCIQCTRRDTRAVLSEDESCDAVVNFDHIEFYNNIMWFLCSSTAFLCTSVTIQMLKSHTVRWFSRPWPVTQNHGNSRISAYALHF